MGNNEDSDHNGWIAALSIVTFTFYAGSLTAIVLFYVYYTGEAVGECKLHEFFISFNMILCIILSVISVLPKVQENLPNSGLLQSSCITLYVLYLTWTALTQFVNRSLTEIIAPSRKILRTLLIPIPNLK